MPAASRAVVVLIVGGIVAVGGLVIYYDPGSPAVSCQGQAMPRGSTCRVMTSDSQESRTYDQQAEAQRSQRAENGLTAGVVGSLMFLAAAGYLLINPGANRD
ncbi:hypothetical protein [Actinoplanes couchii]|uniref:Integral membrane protein n=1 Tax=Actinoplanes couchii TaxID=403638 RepID=A0ABQ3X279_9ACTN|nr:hypothetical protein [Actinoplanes couchii]MDR6317015.1 hypothetical protein [Actinoplanes couchii]GID52624.1 hypothetical protein Aco03nite_010280 [Actinoplanes couchii]